MFLKKYQTFLIEILEYLREIIFYLKRYLDCRLLIFIFQRRVPGILLDIFCDFLDLSIFEVSSWRRKDLVRIIVGHLFYFQIHFLFSFLQPLIHTFFLNFNFVDHLRRLPLLENSINGLKLSINIKVLKQGFYFMRLIILGNKSNGFPDFQNCSNMVIEKNWQLFINNLILILEIPLWDQ